MIEKEYKPDTIAHLQISIGYILVNPTFMIYDASGQYEAQLDCISLASFANYDPPQYVYGADYQIPIDGLEGEWRYELYDNKSKICDNYFMVKYVLRSEVSPNILRIAREGDGSEIIEKQQKFGIKNMKPMEMGRG